MSAAAAVQYCLASLRDESLTSRSAQAERYRERDAAWVMAMASPNESVAHAAFQSLFEAYIAPLIRFATSYLHDDGAAEEAVEDVFLGIWGNRLIWAPEHGAAVYLYGAVRNRTHNYQRTFERRVKLASAAERSEEIPGLGAAPMSAADLVERAEVSAMVWRAIDALPEPRKQAVILRWHHGMSAPEIADVLGVSTGAVYQLLNRAHALLRELLGPALI